jgi:hypothetical protein
MTDHVLGYVNGHMSTAIMDGDRMADHLREYRARPAPGPDDLLIPTLVHIFDFVKELRIDEGPLL